MQFQHHREDDTMEHDIVFTNDDQFCITMVPVWRPIFAVINGPLFGGADISDRGVKPYIQHFSFTAWDILR